MKRPRRSNAVAYALYANAALLAAILVVMLSRSSTSVISPAYGSAQQPPIAGGGGIYVMPAQMHPNVWGCYLFDNDRQTLCTYEYQAGTRELVLTSARDFRYDIQLKNFNTIPAPFDVKKLVADQDQNERASSSKVPLTSPETPTQNQ